MRLRSGPLKRRARPASNVKGKRGPLGCRCNALPKKRKPAAQAAAAAEAAEACGASSSASSTCPGREAPQAAPPQPLAAGRSGPSTWQCRRAPEQQTQLACGRVARHPHRPLQAAAAGATGASRQRDSHAQQSAAQPPNRPTAQPRNRWAPAVSRRSNLGACRSPTVGWAASDAQDGDMHVRRAGLLYFPPPASNSCSSTGPARAAQLSSIRTRQLRGARRFGI
jgi:hypothetical protein